MVRRWPGVIRTLEALDETTRFTAAVLSAREIDFALQVPAGWAVCPTAITGESSRHRTT